MTIKIYVKFLDFMYSSKIYIRLENSRKVKCNEVLNFEVQGPAHATHVCLSFEFSKFHCGPATHYKVSVQSYYVEAMYFVPLDVV
jgi:hypothetical protein